MKRHDETLLWQYAARELDLEEAALIEHHLTECVECRERLLDVRQARLVLHDAQAPRPLVEWAKVDQGISQLVEARLLRQAKSSRWGWRIPIGLGAVAAAVVAVVVSTARLELARPDEVASKSEPAGGQIEQALGLHRVGAELKVARPGERLVAGEVLRTAVGGVGQVVLADGSRMRLLGGSQLALTRTESDDVALTLERGRVAVEASHRERRGFVVHTNGLSVRVVGTLFSVSQVGGAVEVVVADGKVRVEPPEGDALSLVGGEKVRFNRGGWKPLRGPATLSQLAELNGLTEPPLLEAAGAPRIPAGGLMPAGAIARRDDSAARNTAVQQPSQVVGVALTPEAPAGDEGPLPRKPSVPRGQATVWPSKSEARAGTGGPVEVTEEEAPQLEEKASVWPSFGSGPTTYEPRVLKRKSAPRPAEAPAAVEGTTQLEIESPAPAAQPAEIGDWPKPAAVHPQPVQEPQPEVKAPVEPKPSPRPALKGKNGDPLPEDLEALFLQRAERGLERGICERYLLGLQEIAGDVSRNERAQKARILRARCYDARVRPDLSEVEYRRYLEQWPQGRHADEAKKAILE